MKWKSIAGFAVLNSPADLYLPTFWYFIVASIPLVDVMFLWNSVRIPSAVAVVQLRITVKPQGYKITNCKITSTFKNH